MYKPYVLTYVIKMELVNSNTMYLNNVQKDELRREDALDCFYSIIDIVEKHFATTDFNFVVWMTIVFERLKKDFDYSLMLEKIIVIQDYIRDKYYMNECAYMNINEMITTICHL